MEKVKIFYSIMNCGDGSAYPRWFLTEEYCDAHGEKEEWGEPCVGSVETFVDSDIYNAAVKSDKEWEHELEEEALIFKESQEAFDAQSPQSCKECNNSDEHKYSQGFWYSCLILERSISDGEKIDDRCPFIKT